jgi:hypothetical protein
MRGWLVLVVLLCAAKAEADAPTGDAPELELSSPYDAAIRNHYYTLLARSPTRALLWEVALPGAGLAYSRFYLQAAISATLTLTGASLWVAGAVRDDDQLWWAGAGTFAAGRLYGVISAPVSAALLNAAFRRQFGITRRF